MRPQPGDRIVLEHGGRWLQYRHSVGDTRTNPRYHGSREEAMRQAGRLAVEEGVAVFLLEQTGEGGRYRLLRERLLR